MICTPSQILLKCAAREGTDGWGMQHARDEERYFLGRDREIRGKDVTLCTLA